MPIIQEIEGKFQESITHSIRIESTLKERVRTDNESRDKKLRVFI